MTNDGFMNPAAAGDFCRALGLDARLVKTLDIHIEPPGVFTVTVEQFGVGPDGNLKDAATVITKHRLVREESPQ